MELTSEQKSAYDKCNKCSTKQYNVGWRRRLCLRCWNNEGGRFPIPKDTRKPTDGRSNKEIIKRYKKIFL